MESVGASLKGSLQIEETELRLQLGLSGTQDAGHRVGCVNNKRSFPESESSDYCGSSKGSCSSLDHESPPVTTKAQIVGWPPIRSYRRNNLVQPKKAEGDVAPPGIFVKVSLDGAPYLRKVDLKLYNGYQDLLKALENMFELTIGQYSEREGYKGSDYSPTYEDKDGDWMLVGDVPWEMFMVSCKRLRIMRGSKAQILSSGV
ncbi:hypothetical protein MLD38_021370 [Melastoma candidum]|uniref:Uncharacterized protein n=1 Tax=Melastoma candidum TaxID=119954 RepID=A0ACB9QFW8_9MYRT|nr:hypothetical protein MLD38_021370 [Melastoma candidum]